MTEEISVVVQLNECSEKIRAIHRGLYEANIAAIQEPNDAVICTAAISSKNGLIGGIHGEVFFGWVSFVGLWVHPDYRRRSIGTSLLEAAEVRAVELNCTNACLDTFSFQSPEIYMRCGYQEFGRLENFPTGHTRYYMRKTLKRGA